MKNIGGGDPSSGNPQTERSNPTTWEEERDEVREVRQRSSRDTRRIRLWRCVVMGSLVATAVAITLVTFQFLEDEQDGNFRTAVST